MLTVPTLPKLVQLRNRISQNTKFISTEPAEPVQPVKPAAQSFQPIATPVAPASANPGRVNPMSRRKPKGAQRAPAAQPTPFTPAAQPTQFNPAPVSAQPVSSGFAPAPQPTFQPPVQPQPSFQPVSAPQPTFQPVSAPQPVPPTFAPTQISAPSNPVQQIPAPVSQPLSTPTMQPQPVSQSMNLPPTGSTGFNPGMSTGGMYSGGNMYQADISHIPKGPAPDRKEATPGWNDPKNKPEYAKSVDSSMRLNKKSKKAPGAPSVPAEMPVFTPAPAPQNSMNMGMGGMPPMGQPMGMAPPMGQPMGLPNQQMGLPSQPMGMQLPPTPGLNQPMGGSSLMQPAPMGAPTPSFQGRIK